MCVTLKLAALRGTLILTGDLVDGRRYIVYRNTVHDFDFTPRTAQPRSPAAAARGDKPDLSVYDNCLAFPIPGYFDSLDTPDVSGLTSNLDRITETIDRLYPMERSSAVAFGSKSILGGGVKIIVTDFYATIFAADATAIPAALKEHGASAELIAAAGISEQFQRAYSKKLPFMLSLFSAAQEQRAALVITFKPLSGFEDSYWFPTLDGHGSLDFRADVWTDHHLAIASQRGAPVEYRESTFGNPYLPRRVVGIRMRGKMPNGDVLARRSDAENGVFSGARIAPFGLDVGESPLVNASIPLTLESTRFSAF